MNNLSSLSEHKNNTFRHFRNSLKMRGFNLKSNEELTKISSIQSEAVDALLLGLNATANMAFYATLNPDYEEANDDLQKLSYYMMFASEILHSFVSNTKQAERVLRQRENV